MKKVNLIVLIIFLMFSCMETEKPEKLEVEEKKCDEGTICNENSISCETIEGWCSSDQNCSNNDNGKTSCNLETHKCFKEIEDINPDGSIEKEDLLDEFANAACEKYQDCNDDSRYNNLQECKDSQKEGLNTLWENYCNVYDSNKAYKLVRCVKLYVCSDDGNEDLGYTNCVNEQSMCWLSTEARDFNQENANSYCNKLFECNEEEAVERYKDISSCKAKTANLITVDFERKCSNYKSEYLNAYIDCRDQLTCEQTLEECFDIYTSMCLSEE